MRFYKHLIWALAATGGILATNLSANSELRLPDIGDSASITISRAEERQLGAMILGQIRTHLNVLSDPELHTYIQSLGTQLTSSGIESNLDFTFLLLSDSSINAFAAPGGIIAVNTGLLNTSKTESELAGVLAHEIAHVEQRHLARAYENANKINLATALGVLASIAAGLYNPQLGGAALQSTVAAGAQAQLSFSRANEREADRVGMGLLANTGFDPNGMPIFLERLHKTTQLSVGPIPEFMSTHPITLSRISDTKNRASKYQGEFRKDNERFQYAKARSLALTKVPSSIVSRYERVAKTGKKLTAVDRYTYALALTRAGNPQRAAQILKKLASDHDTLPVQLALAQAEIRNRNTKQALKILQRLNKIYPSQEAIVYYLADVLIDLNKPEDALSYLEQITKRKRHNPVLDQLQAKAAQHANQPWRSHEAMANYYVAYGQFSEAMEQLEFGLNSKQIDAYTQAKLRAKRRKLKEESKERHYQ